MFNARAFTTAFTVPVRSSSTTVVAGSPLGMCGRGGGGGCVFVLVRAAAGAGVGLGTETSLTVVP